MAFGSGVDLRKLLVVTLLTTLLPMVIRAAEPSAIAWRELPGVDGQPHSLDDLADRDVVIVAVTCNHCPIALEYFERVKTFVAEHCQKDGKAALVAVSVSQLETDKLERMKVLAERQEFNFPYLYDETQSLGKALGATHTPQFFVLDRDRKIAYTGPWDDNINATKVKTRYVEDAVAALLSGKTPDKAKVKPIGCLITYEKGK
jgi:peroxiredoxin